MPKTFLTIRAVYAFTAIQLFKCCLRDGNVALISVAPLQVLSHSHTYTPQCPQVGPVSYLAGICCSCLFSSAEHLACNPAIVVGVAGIVGQDGDVHLLQSTHKWSI